MTFHRLAQTPRRVHRLILCGCAVAALSACDEPLDFDLRGLADGFSTSEAALEARTAPRPEPDSNGVISYPNYQVAVARKGDTINTIAERLGLSASELSRYNGIPENVAMLSGEVIALPYRIEGGAATAATPTGTIATGERIDVTTLANEVLSNEPVSTPTPIAPAASTPAASPSTSSSSSADTLSTEPVRHQVKRGETAYSIARTYGVSVRALSDWNGLGSDLAVQEGRYVLIPVKSSSDLSEPLDITPPAPASGTASPTPVPPSASTALPEPEEATPEPVAVAAAPQAAPDLGATQSASSEMTTPVSGPIIRDYDPNKSRFMLFSAPAGTTVSAAKAGTVKLVSTNADGVQIMVVDHGDGLQTAYSFIDDLSVSKGDTVSKGQAIAKVTENEFNALQFMVFKGTQTVDPSPFLN